MPHFPITYSTSDTTGGSLTINIQRPWAWAWPILALVSNAFACDFLHRNQDLKEVFGAKEQEWVVNAVVLVGQNLVPFLLLSSFVFSSRIRDKFKNNLFLNVFLTYLCLSVPALFSHVLQYGAFHMEVEDIEQHNSRSIHNLLTACLYAISSLCLSQTLLLPFEAGFFSACLGYAMQVSLAILDKNGNSKPVYVSCTFFFCFIFIMVRKYLEKDEGIDRTMQRDNQIPVGTDTDQSPDSAYNTIELQTNQNRVIESTNVHTNRNPNEPTPRDLTLEVSMGKYGSDERDIRQESWDGDEHHCCPPRLYMDTSSSSGDTADEEEEEEEVLSVSKCVVKEDKDIIMTHLEVSKPSDEGTNASDDHVAKIEESEVPGQEIVHEEQDMRSSTSSGHMEIAGSSRFGGYEKDDVPLLLPKSDNIIDGEAQIVSNGLGQMERSVDQSQENGSQGYEKDDNPPLLPMSSLKVDKDSTHLGTSELSDDDGHSDHESSDDEGSDGDGFHGGTGRKLGVGWKGKDPGQESDCQKQGNMRSLWAYKSQICKEVDVSVILSKFKNMKVDLGQMEGSVYPRDGINYEEQITVIRGEMKNKLERWLVALISVWLSITVLITTHKLQIEKDKDSSSAGAFLSQNGFAMKIGICNLVGCLLALLSFCLHCYQRLGALTDRTRSALNDNTDSNNGEPRHTDSDFRNIIEPPDAFTDKTRSALNDNTDSNNGGLSHTNSDFRNIIEALQR